jgi:hypothetical protein
LTSFEEYCLLGYDAKEPSRFADVLKACIALIFYSSLFYPEDRDYDPPKASNNLTRLHSITPQKRKSSL